MHIYLIDDDYVNNLIFTNTLQSSIPNTTVIVFTTIESALVAFEQMTLTPQVIILDIYFEDMELDGWDFLDIYLAKYQHLNIPIAMASSSIDRRDFKKMANYPLIQQIFVKPITDDLLDWIRQYA